MKGSSIHIICVGKLKEKFYIDGAAEYVKRLGGYCKLRLTELPEERLPQNPSRAQIDAALEKEAAAVTAKLPKSGAVVALCVEGQLLSSEKLAARLEGWTGQGKNTLTFLIGSSYGMHPSLKEKADLRLSMSPGAVRPPRARVRLLEQRYRGVTIVEGCGYHK